MTLDISAGLLIGVRTRDKDRVLGAVLRLEEDTEAMTVELDISGRVLAMESARLKTRHPFSRILQTSAGTMKKMNGSQWMVDLAAATRTAMKSMGTRISALNRAMRRQSIASPWRRREITGLMLALMVELLRLRTTDMGTDKGTDRYIFHLYCSASWRIGLMYCKSN